MKPTNEIHIIGNVGGNVGKFAHAYILLRKTFQIVERPVKTAPIGLIIPGVGSSSILAKNLKNTGWASYIRDLISMDIPVMGICSGFQALTTGYLEEGSDSGLQIFDSHTYKLKSSVMPNYGWKSLQSLNSTLFKGVPENGFYFRHHFYVQPDIYTEDTLVHGNTIVSAVSKKGSVYGLQFHPESSGLSGLVVLKNFYGICARWAGEVHYER